MAVVWSNTVEEWSNTGSPVAPISRDGLSLACLTTGSGGLLLQQLRRLQLGLRLGQIGQLLERHRRQLGVGPRQLHVRQQPRGSFKP